MPGKLHRAIFSSHSAGVHPTIVGWPKEGPGFQADGKGPPVGLLQPLATKALVDRLSSGGTITTVPLALTVLVLLSTVAEAFAAPVLERTAESVVLAARRSLIGRLLRLRLAEVDRRQPGDPMSRVTSDTTLLRAVSTQAVVSAARELSTGLERAFGAFRTVKASGAEERETARVEAAARSASSCRARHDVARQLVEVEEAREHERALYAQNVLARERAQLAREMHDVVSHQVSLIAVQAGALQVAAKDPDAREAARTIRSLSVNTLDELRHMVTLLRASGGKATELTPQPTLADLHRLVATSGIGTTLTGELPPGISTTAQRTVYRTVQEALTNVRKHAPGARAEVHLRYDTSHFRVTVTNTAPTRPCVALPSSRQGLIGLRERADLLHGTFTAEPTPQGGYMVDLRAPPGPAETGREGTRLTR